MDSKFIQASVTKIINSLPPDILLVAAAKTRTPDEVKQAIEAGARGYITKDEISEDIVKAIRQILKGQIYMSSRLLKNLSKEKLDGFVAGKVQGCCD